jgi:hypothetical protein
LARGRRIDAEIDDAESRLRELVERETAERADELDRTLARARADSASLLAEQERKLADARRSELNDRERRMGAELGDALTLRRADEAAKVVGAAVPGLDHWRPVVERVAR